MTAEVSDADLYRAHMRSEFNSSGGKRGYWARGRDPVPRIAFLAWKLKRVGLARRRAKLEGVLLDVFLAKLSKFRGRDE